MLILRLKILRFFVRKILQLIGYIYILNNDETAAKGMILDNRMNKDFISIIRITFSN